MKKKKIVTITMTTGLLMTNISPLVQVFAQEAKPKTESKNEVNEHQKLEQRILDAKQVMDTRKVNLEEAKQKWTMHQAKQKLAQDEWKVSENKYQNLKDTMARHVEKQVLDQNKRIAQENKQRDEILNQSKELETTLEKQKIELIKAQEKLEQAKQNYEAVKTQDVDKTVLLKAREQMESAKSELDALQQQKQDADQALKEATMVLEEKEQSIKEQQQKLLESQQAKIQADKKVGAAQQEVEKAKEELSLLESSNAKELLENQLELANEALQQAIDLQTQAQKDIDAKNAMLIAAQQELKTLILNRKQTEQEYISLRNEINEKENILANLKTEFDSLQMDKQKLQEKSEALQQQVQAKEAELLQSQQELETINQNITLTKQALKEAKEKLRQYTDVSYEDSAKGFYKSLGAEGKKAVEILGVDHNGMSLSEMERSLEHIKKCNEIRKSIGLQPLLVSTDMMAMANRQTLASKEIWERDQVLEHTKIFPVGENLAVVNPSDNPFDGWYNDEKKVFDYLIANNLTIDQVKNDPAMVTKIARQLSLTEHMIQIGHYESIVNENYLYTGYALKETRYVFPSIGRSVNRQTAPMVLYGQTFSMNPSNGLHACSVDDYIVKLQKYKENLASGMNSQETNKLRQNIQELENKLNHELYTKKTFLENKIDQIEKELSISKDNYVNNENTIQEKDTDMLTKAQEITEKGKALKNSKIKEKQESLQTKQKQIDQKNDEITHIQHLVLEAQDVYSTKQASTSAKQTDVKRLQEQLNNLDHAKMQAKKNVSDKENTLQMAQSLQSKNELKVNDSQELIQRLSEELAAHQMKKAQREADVVRVSNGLETVLERYKEVSNHYEMLENKKNLHLDAKQEYERSKNQVKELGAFIDTSLNNQLSFLQELENTNSKIKEMKLKLRVFESLQEEVKTVIEGKQPVFFDSSDPFVLNVRSLYPLLAQTKAQRDKAKERWGRVKEEAEPYEFSYFAALKLYNDAKDEYDQLIEHMNQKLEQELRSLTQQEKVEKQSKKVSTAHSFDLSVMMTLTAASGGVILLSQKRKNQDMYSKLK